MGMTARIIVAAAIAMAAAACSRSDGEDTRLYSELRSVDRIVLASMSISKMATVDDMTLAEARGLKQSAGALLSSLKIGDRVAAYSYDTYLQAYIDMSDLRPEDISVDRERRHVSVKLPPVQTRFAGRDIELREEHYRVTGMRSDIDARERAAIKERMNTRIKEEVESNDTFRATLVDRARAKARTYIESLAAAAGYTASVSFR